MNVIINFFFSKYYRVIVNVSHLNMEVYLQLTAVPVMSVEADETQVSRVNAVPSHVKENMNVIAGKIKVNLLEILLKAFISFRWI